MISRIMIITGCDFLCHTIHFFFFCASKAVYRKEHCSCLPINATGSNLRCHLDWYHSQQTPWPCRYLPVRGWCDRMARASLNTWRGKAGWGGFSQASIAAVLNYHKQMLAAQLIRNAIQSPWQSKPLTGNSRDRNSLHSQFSWSGQWRLFSLS